MALGSLEKLRFDKLSANGIPCVTASYPFVLSLSKHERMVF
jgi:hypothetical protein